MLTFKQTNRRTYEVFSDTVHLGQIHLSGWDYPMWYFHDQLNNIFSEQFNYLADCKDQVQKLFS